MLTRTAIAVAAVATCAGHAFAADVDYYPAQPTTYAPPMTSPVYSQSSMVTGDVSLAFGGWWYNDGGSDSGTFLDADARVNLPVGNSWNLMPEAYLSADLKYSGDTTISGILHFYKNLPNAAIGPFVAVTGNTAGGSTLFTIGGEARTTALGPNIALTGQASYNTVNSYSFGQFGAFLDYYITPDCKITGAFQIAAGSGETYVEGSAKVTKHLANSRFNLFAAAYVNSYGHGDSEFSAEIGATANFASIIETLVDQDNHRPFHFASIGGAVER